MARTPERRLFDAMDAMDTKAFDLILAEHPTDLKINDYIIIDGSRLNLLLHRSLGYLHHRNNFYFFTKLAKYPGADVNLTITSFDTLFLKSCRKDSQIPFRILIGNPETKLDIPGFVNRLPLCQLLLDNRIEHLKRWIASGRDIDLCDGKYYSVRSRMGDISNPTVDLLNDYVKTPDLVRHAVRRELGGGGEEGEFKAELAADFFAVVIFVCDGLLEFDEERAALFVLPETASRNERFLRIASGLPIDLQLILCNRAAGSMAANIPGATRETAFRALAKALLS